MGIIKLKISCSAKDPVKRMKIQDTDWEKVFANYISHKEFISRIYIQRILKTLQ